jgi:hypothetical protein
MSAGSAICAIKMIINSRQIGSDSCQLQRGLAALDGSLATFRPSRAQ